MKATLVEAARQGVLVCDGAMGTELMKRGLEPGACPEMWNIERSREVERIHRSYIEAGANVIITNTFGGSRWKLEGYGLGGHVAEFNAAAVENARRAAGDAVYVLGDIGPTGRFMAPLGTDPREAFVEVYAEQAKALAGAGADAVILETFTDLGEILAAVEGARRTGLPVVASMSYSRDVAGTYHTMMGNEPGASARALDKAGAAVIGANCGSGPGDYAGIASAIRGATSKPIIVEPNAGMPELRDGRTVFPMTPAEFGRHVGAIAAAGARIIGGCCGTTPEHIRAVRDALVR